MGNETANNTIEMSGGNASRCVAMNECQAEKNGKKMKFLYGSLQCLENPLAIPLALLPKHMPLHIFIPEHPLRIHAVQHPHKVIEPWIYPSQVGWAQTMRFRPVRSSAVSCDKILEVGEDFAVGHVEAVWSVRCTNRNDRWPMYNIGLSECAVDVKKRWRKMMIRHRHTQLKEWK